jgi:precorrin-3B C17-methyltransferase
LLRPWEWIELHAQHLARADIAVALSNVQSRACPDGIRRVLGIFLESRAPQTLCGVVRNAWREGHEARICTLAELLEQQFDMRTTIIVGNSRTRRKGRYLYAPRGYSGWEEARAETEEPAEPGVWVFSGTSDGNVLARCIARAGRRTIISTSSEHEFEIAEAACPGLSIHAARIGADARKADLERSRAQAIVDATHPFAAEISRQLIGLSRELGLPYIRYERPRAPRDGHAIHCADLSQAARKAISVGRRIFLATGSKDLAAFLQCDGAARREWFARVTPEAASIEGALRAGIPRAHLCAMQGPFSSALNEAIWRDWQIDCVVTKDSGDAGGFAEKAAAAEALRIPLIAIERPVVEYPIVLEDFAAVLRHLDLVIP